MPNQRATVTDLAGRTVPVVADVDVVVVGGGFPGVCAALAAARLGANVAIVERDGLLGGQAAEVYTFHVSAYFDNNGKQFIRGIPWQIVKRTIAEGQSDPLWNGIDFARMEREGLDAEMRRFGLTARPWKYLMYVDPNAFRYVLHAMAEEEGITTLLESPLSGVLMDGTRVDGIVAEGAYGPFAVRAGVTVDTTPQAAVAGLAGYPFPCPEVYMGTHPRVGGVEIDRLLEYASESSDVVSVRGITAEDLPERERLSRSLDDLTDRGIDKNDCARLRELIHAGVSLLFSGFSGARKKAAEDNPIFEITGMDDSGTIWFFYEHDGCGSYWVHSCTALRNTRLDDPLLLSRTIVHFRQKQWLTHRVFRDYVPGFEKARLMDVHPHTARALCQSKEPAGFTEYDIPWDHIAKGTRAYPDSIARVMGHYDKGAATGGWQFPYRSLIPKSLEGVLVTGKPACRWLHLHATHAAVAQAAGVAAALAAKSNLPLRRLAPSDIQSQLQQQGAIVF